MYDTDSVTPSSCSMLIVAVSSLQVVVVWVGLLVIRNRVVLLCVVCVVCCRLMCMSAWMP